MLVNLQLSAFLLLQEGGAVGFDLLSMWNQMGWAARAVVIVLFIMSAYSIGIMIDRLMAFSAARKQSRLFAPFTRVRIESVGDPRGLIVTFNVRGVITNPRLGYELDVRQAGRRLFRVRGAGRCSAFGCVFSRLNLQRP